MGRQIRILATYQDLFDIVQQLKEKSNTPFIRVDHNKEGKGVYEVPLFSAPRWPHFPILLTPQTIDGIRSEMQTTRVINYLTVELSPSFGYQDNYETMPEVNEGRIYVPTYYFSGYASPSLLNLYDEILKIVKKNSIHYKRENYRMLTYILPDAEKLMPRCEHLYK